jgi:SpoIIAA-like
MRKTTGISGAAMIDHHWDTDHSILTVRPESALSTSDFAALARTVDPKIEHGEDLAGLIIDAPRFPGWDSYGAMVSHYRFVRDHHKHVKKIAIVTDLPIAGIAQHLVSHFIDAQIRHFPTGHVTKAENWITGGAQ